VKTTMVLTLPSVDGYWYTVGFFRFGRLSVTSSGSFVRSSGVGFVCVEMKAISWPPGTVGVISNSISDVTKISWIDSGDTVISTISSSWAFGETSTKTSLDVPLFGLLFGTSASIIPYGQMVGTEVGGVGVYVVGVVVGVTVVYVVGVVVGVTVV